MTTDPGTTARIYTSNHTAGPGRHRRPTFRTRARAAVRTANPVWYFTAGVLALIVVDVALVLFARGGLDDGAALARDVLAILFGMAAS